MKYRAMTLQLTQTFLLLAALTVGSLALLLIQATPKVSAQSCEAVNNDIGSATFALNVTTSDTYKVWMRIASPSNEGSVQLKVNDDCHRTFGASDLRSDTLTWVNSYIGGGSVTANLSSGVNNFELVGVTESLMVDQVLFINGDCVPEGNGDNCAVNDESAPVVSITNPKDGETVSGDVDLKAFVTDDDTDLTVTFFVDGESYGTAGKNNMSEWFVQVVTENLSDGSHTVRVEAVDSAGNKGTATSTFVVNNGTAPKPPEDSASEVKLTAIDDTFARSDSPNSTNENSTLHTDGRPEKVTYVKFELPENVDVTAAQLSLYSIRKSNDTLAVHKTDSNWGEDTLTWNNRPSLGSQVGSINGAENEAWVNVDVTDGIESGARYVSFAIKTDENVYSRFNSKEKERGETGPYLYINTTSSTGTGDTGGQGNESDGGTNTGGDTTGGSGSTNDGSGSQGNTNNPTSTSHVATEDSFVRSDQPTATARTNSLHTDASPQKIIYLKFNVSDVAGKTVEKATLRLYNIEGSSNGGTVTTVSNDSWTEATLNWNNRPTIGTTVLANIGNVTTNNWVEVDLSLTQVDSDGTITLAIYNESDQLARYQSLNQSDGQYAAELLLNTY